MVAQNAKDTKGKKAEKDKALVSISKSLVLAPEEGHGGSWTRGLDALRNGTVLLSLLSLLALLVLAVAASTPSETVLSLYYSVYLVTCFTSKKYKY